jgi:hypothetical protein
VKGSRGRSIGRGEILDGNVGHVSNMKLASDS